MDESNTRRDLILFDEKGPGNTTSCFEAVADRVRALNLDHIVVASTTGETGSKAVKFFEDYDINLIIVSHQFGFREDGDIELKDEYRRKIEEADNASLVVTPDVLTRIPKIVRGKYGGFSFLDLIADTLRLFSEGVKVCIECVVQAADSGKVPVGEEIAAIAGTGSGADTGVVLESQHSHKIFDIDIRELICLPRKR